MADANAGASFDEIIQEGRRKRAAEKLAQEIFGKKGRSSAPPSGPKASLGGSLASRVGIVKRNSPSPRSNPPRVQARPPPPSRPSAYDNSRPRLSHTQSSAPDLGVGGVVKSNGNARDDDMNGGPELNIKGAASGPYIVVAQNFAPGTTAADIEQVMLGVGGAMNSCKLVASNPTVIAEMSFVEKVGAEKVIETFNNKKADGRPLYVYMKSRGGAASKPAANDSRNTQPINISSDEVEEVTMEVDENAESREAENRRREEHRSRDDRASRDVFPTGPRGYRAEMDRFDDYRNRRPEPGRPEPGYQDGRYGFGGRGGFRDGPRGGYPRDGRRYGGGGQSWRP